MACKRRKKDKRALDLKRIRERRNHLNTDVNEDNSINSISSVLEEEKEEEREFQSTPAFSVGEVVSIKGDTTQRGY